MEEVNAWANYEYTGASARAFGKTRTNSAAVLRQRRTHNNANNTDLTNDNKVPRRSIHAIHSEVLLSQSTLALDQEAIPLTPQASASNPTQSQKKGDPETSSSSSKMPPEIRVYLQEICSVYFGGAHSTRYYHQQENQQTRPFWQWMNGTMPWLPSWIQRHTNSHWSSLLLFLEANLRGIAQVYFQNNPVSGLLILVGLFIQNPRIAVHGILALMTGNLVVPFLGFDQGLQRSGLFGYSAVLVGLAMATFDSSQEYNAATLLASVAYSALSSIIFVALGKLLVPYKSPPLTLPFNIVTLLFLLGSYGMGRVDRQYTFPTDLPDPDAAATGTMSVEDFFKATLRGIGQVFLVDDLVASLFILAGITVCSRISAIAAIVGSAVGTTTAILLGSSSEAMTAGLFGYNASLTLTGMLLFYAPTTTAIILATIAAIATVLIQVAVSTLLQPYGLPAMTVPFCLMALPFIILQGTTQKMIAVPLAAITTPEDHVQKVHTLRYGFALLMEAIHHSSASAGNDVSSSRRLKQSLSNISQTISKRHNTSSTSIVDGHTEGSATSHRPAPSKKEAAIIDHANQIFSFMDPDTTGSISLEHFKATLQDAGFDNQDDGLAFAMLVCKLLDLDHTVSLEREEFGTFCLISVALSEIRSNCTKFVDFVDVDGDDTVDFDEIDIALVYLGESPLKLQDRQLLARAVGHIGKAVSEYDNIHLDAVELINFVLLSAMKHLVESHQQNMSSVGNDETV